MPHIQFDLNFSPAPEQKTRFARSVADHFGRIMETGTDHVAVVVRGHDAEALLFGRAAQAGGRMAFVNADIRGGRTSEQKRRFALAIVAELEAAFGVPEEAAYLVFTEHEGEDFHLYDRVLPSWKKDEDPLE